MKEGPVISDDLHRMLSPQQFFRHLQGVYSGIVHSQFREINPGREEEGIERFSRRYKLAAGEEEVGYLTSFGYRRESYEQEGLILHLNSLAPELQEIAGNGRFSGLSLYRRIHKHHGGEGHLYTRDKGLSHFSNSIFRNLLGPSSTPVDLSEIFPPDSFILPGTNYTPIGH